MPVFLFSALNKSARYYIKTDKPVMSYIRSIKRQIKTKNIDTSKKNIYGIIGMNFGSYSYDLVAIKAVEAIEDKFLNHINEIDPSCNNKTCKKKITFRDLTPPVILQKYGIK